MYTSYLSQNGQEELLHKHSDYKLASSHSVHSGVRQLVHQPVTFIDVSQGYHHCCALGTEESLPHGKLAKIIISVRL